MLLLVFRLFVCLHYKDERILRFLASFIIMAFRYTNVEYCEMVRMLARCDDNVNLAVRTFREKYKVPVSNATMSAATQRLRDYGTFRPSTAVDRGAGRLKPNLELQILNYFHENPKATTRQAAERFRCSNSFVSTILQEDHQTETDRRKLKSEVPKDTKRGIMKKRLRSQKPVEEDTSPDESDDGDNKIKIELIAEQDEPEIEMLESKVEAADDETNSSGMLEYDPIKTENTEIKRRRV